MSDDDRIMKREPLPYLGGLFIPVLAISLIFGNTLVGFVAIVLGLLAAALALFPGTRQRMEALLAQKGARQGMALLIPILAVAGIFGNSLLMVMVLVMAFVALLVAALSARVGEWPTAYAAYSQPVEAAPPAAAPVPALPAQASGEKIGELDLRALCRGLPPSVSGQVIATVEHLELVAVEAQKNGDTRRSYDARQGLQDYLPNTITAWKAQPEHQRDLRELEQALTQVRQIAGPDDVGGEAGRKAWETQQRFLASRSDKNRDG